MIKKMFTLAALIVVTLSLSGCFWEKETIITEPTPPAAEETVPSSAPEAAISNDQEYTYTNKEKGFSCTLPAEWTFQENVFGSLVMFFAPQKEGDKIKENIGIVTTQLTGEVDLKSFFELTKGNVESVINDFKLEKEETVTINGEPAMKIIYKGVEGEIQLERQQIVLLKGNTAFVFTYTATEDTFNDLIDEVDTIINSFRIQ